MIKNLMINTFWNRVAHFYDDALRGINWTEKQAAIAEGVSGRVLEACCGTGSLALTLRQRGVDVYALDLAPRMLARAAFLPDITFDQQNRVLLIGRGASEHRIPFSDLSRVVVEPVQDRVGGFEVTVVRGDGERIKLGILSGSGMAESAQGIALLIERVTGAQAHPPGPELG